MQAFYLLALLFVFFLINLTEDKIQLDNSLYKSFSAHIIKGEDIWTSK